MSAYMYDVCLLYDVCLPVVCLSTCIMSAQVYNVYLPILCLAICALDVWLPLPKDVLVPVCLSSCMISAQYDVCIPVLYLPPVWYLFNFMMSAYLYDVCSTLWCLPTCVLSVCSTIWCLPIYTWCPPSCMISSYPYDVCSTVSCLPTCVVSALLYCMTSAYLYTWCLAICMVSAYLYDCFLTVWCLPILNVGYRIDRYRIHIS
jgi:hypothetical protein